MPLLVCVLPSLRSLVRSRATLPLECSPSDTSYRSSNHRGGLASVSLPLTGYSGVVVASDRVTAGARSRATGQRRRVAPAGPRGETDMFWDSML